MQEEAPGVALPRLRRRQERGEPHRVEDEASRWLVRDGRLIPYGCQIRHGHERPAQVEGSGRGPTARSTLSDS